MGVHSSLVQWTLGKNVDYMSIQLFKVLNLLVYSESGAQEHAGSNLKSFEVRSIGVECQCAYTSMLLTSRG
jgi:hypothetical protein